jgi:hypothetical protein
MNAFKVFPDVGRTSFSKGGCAVLSDHERQTLREVERRMATEDPEFIRSFDTRAQRLHGGSDRWGLRIFVVIGLLLSVMMLVIGSLSGAAGFAFVTGLIWLAWRFSVSTPQQSP